MEGEARAELGEALRARGRYAEASAEIEQALTTLELIDDRRGRARVLNQLEVTQREAGDPMAATATQRQALDAAQAVSQRAEVGRAHLGLGDCASEPGVAVEHWRTAERIFADLAVPDRAAAVARLQEAGSQNADTGVSH